MFGGDFFSQFTGGPTAEEDAEEVENTELYEVLDLEPSATAEQIKARYRKLVMQHHPDKGGDANKFKEINAANEVLSDPEKRKIYDKYGLEGLRNTDNSGGMNDIFDLFFGGGRRKGAPHETPKLKPKVQKLDITLEDIYSGKDYHIEIQRLKVCIDCNGKGGDKVEKCSVCDGKGAVIKMIQVGPGMYAQSQARCDDCQGAGEKIDASFICKACQGKKTVEKTESIEVIVPIGVPDEHQILINEKGDEHPIYRTGDLIVVLVILPHETFKRIKNDLFITKTISLIEALEGFRFALNRFGTEIVVGCPKDCILNNKDIKIVKNMGMPYFKIEQQKGNLLIEFLVEMPLGLTRDQLDTLRNILPKRMLPPIETAGEVHEFTEGPTSVAPRNHSTDDQAEEQEAEEDGMGGGQRVECQQQ